MPITEYKIVVGSSTKDLTDLLAADGLVPVGDVSPSFDGSYALQAAGVGTLDVGNAENYEVMQGDTTHELVAAVNTKIGAGKQPVGGVVPWHNAFIQVVGVVSASGGGTSSVAWADVTGKPSTFPPVTGTTATTAKPGDYQPTWAQVTGKPAVIASGADQAAARTAIGAGTSSLVLGNSPGVPLNSAGGTGASTNAARDDHVHPYPAQLATGRTFSLTGGATGTSAAFNGAANASIPVTLAAPTTTVRGGALQVATPTIAVTDPVDTANLQAQFDALTNALKSTGIFS